MRQTHHRQFDFRFGSEAGVTLMKADVRFGSKADIGSALGDVRFTPESGHVQCN
jgi:hypothetical protein